MAQCLARLLRTLAHPGEENVMAPRFIPGGTELPPYPWYALPPGADKVPGAQGPLVEPPRAGLPAGVCPHCGGEGGSGGPSPGDGGTPSTSLGMLGLRTAFRSRPGRMSEVSGVGRNVLSTSWLAPLPHSCNTDRGPVLLLSQGRTMHRSRRTSVGTGARYRAVAKPPPGTHTHLSSSVSCTWPRSRTDRCRRPRGQRGHVTRFPDSRSRAEGI